MCNNNATKVFPQPVKKEKPKQKSTPAYYQCLLNESLNGFNGQKITQACRNCKVNGANLASQREQEIHSLLTAYQQIGASLRNLLTPLETNATN